MKREVLEVVNLYWAYPRGFSLEGISFTLGQGERLGILGPNGSGKTTLLKLLLRILPPPRGNFFLDGQDISGLSQRELSRWVAYVPQHGPGQDSFTVEQVLQMGRYPHSRRLQGRDHQIVRRVLEVLGLQDFRFLPVQSLSGGEYQRVLLGRALVQETPLLLLDEPTNHLDLHFQLSLLELLKEEQRRRPLTILSIFHDINLALDFSTSLLVLSRGQGRALGGTKEIVESDILQKTFQLDFSLLGESPSGAPVLLPRLAKKPREL